MNPSQNKMKLHLHIGLPKTGTTTLQNYFAENSRMFFAQKYIYYPCLSRDIRNAASGISMAGNGLKLLNLIRGTTNAADLKKHISRYIGRLYNVAHKAGIHQILISSEALSSLKGKEFIAILEHCTSLGVDLDVILVIRRLPNWLLSVYHQFLLTSTTNQPTFTDFIVKESDTVNPAGILDLLQMLPRENVRIVVADTDMLPLFISLLGLEIDPRYNKVDGSRTRRDNRSLRTAEIHTLSTATRMLKSMRGDQAGEYFRLTALLGRSEGVADDTRTAIVAESCKKISSLHESMMSRLAAYDLDQEQNDALEFDIDTTIKFIDDNLCAQFEQVSILRHILDRFELAAQEHFDELLAISKILAISPDQPCESRIKTITAAVAEYKDMHLYSSERIIRLATLAHQNILLTFFSRDIGAMLAGTAKAPSLDQIETLRLFYACEKIKPDIIEYDTAGCRIYGRASTSSPIAPAIVKAIIRTKRNRLEDVDQGCPTSSLVAIANQFSELPFSGFHGRPFFNGFEINLPDKAELVDVVLVA